MVAARHTQYDEVVHHGKGVQGVDDHLRGAVGGEGAAHDPPTHGHARARPRVGPWRPFSPGIGPFRDPGIWLGPWTCSPKCHSTGIPSSGTTHHPRWLPPCIPPGGPTACLHPRLDPCPPPPPVLDQDWKPLHGELWPKMSLGTEMPNFAEGGGGCFGGLWSVEPSGGETGRGGGYVVHVSETPRKGLVIGTNFRSKRLQPQKLPPMPWA